MLALFAELFEQSSGATHDVVSRVDVKDFAGDTVGVGAQEVGSGASDFFVRYAATEGGYIIVVLLHFPNPGSDPCEGFQRASGDAVDSDTLGSHVVGEVSDGRVEGGFADPHNVVARNAFFATEVGHGQHRGSGFEHRPSGVGNGDQAIDAYIHREFEASAAGLDGVARQVIAIGECDGVK